MGSNIKGGAEDEDDDIVFKEEVGLVIDFMETRTLSILKITNNINYFFWSNRHKRSRIIISF